MTLVDDLDSTVTPLDRYLAEQRRLTAVERFASFHEAGTLPPSTRNYVDLLPLTEPGPGQQYGFEVDLDACTGCKACVVACQSLNGLDPDESWRDVGLLRGTAPGESYQQTVTTGCHHCVEPACLAGCPVDAYEKDPSTGIVSHLDDQCIGCSYCTLTCPYEVPRFNRARGIVRKCDMCRGRLDVGEAPACAQACPNGAIRITIVDRDALRAEAHADASLVPGAPPSALTIPSTRYRTTRTSAPSWQAADFHAVQRAHAHTPLAVMLVLTQLSVGAFVVGLLSQLLLDGYERIALLRTNAVVALSVGVLALAASVLHLGRPRYAYRAVIGIRHSWLSREVVAFGAFAGLAAVYAAMLWLSGDAVSRHTILLGALVAAAGAMGVVCSVAVYAVTGRTWWRGRTCAWKFGLTSMMTGSSTVLCTVLAAAAIIDSAANIRAVRDAIPPLAGLLVAAAFLKLGRELVFLLRARRGPADDLARTAVLLSGELRTLTAWRFTAGCVGGLFVPIALLRAARLDDASMPVLLVLALVGLVGVVAGELMERWAFFTAVAAPRMPGALP